MQVLVVEDDPAQWRIYEHALRSAGHSVFWASRALIAIDFLRTDHFDLVMLDLELDGAMSGLEVKRHIPRGTHIFILSGHPAAEVRETCNADPLLGADFYFDKPVNMGLLEKLIEMVADKISEELKR